jgi:ribonuclease HII
MITMAVVIQPERKIMKTVADPVERLLQTIDGLRISADQLETALKQVTAGNKDEAYVVTAAKVMVQVIRDRALLNTAKETAP